MRKLPHELRICFHVKKACSSLTVRARSGSRALRAIRHGAPRRSRAHRDSRLDTPPSNHRRHPGPVIALLALVGTYGVVREGFVPANADATPGSLETWLAGTSLDATLDREAPTPTTPRPASALASASRHRPVRSSPDYSTSTREQNKCLPVRLNALVGSSRSPLGFSRRASASGPRRSSGGGSRQTGRR